MFFIRCNKYFLYLSVDELATLFEQIFFVLVKSVIPANPRLAANSVLRGSLHAACSL